MASSSLLYLYTQYSRRRRIIFISILFSPSSMEGRKKRSLDNDDGGEGIVWFSELGGEQV